MGLPGLEEISPNPFSRCIDEIGHGLALRGDQHFGHPTVERTLPTLDQSLTFKLGNLPTDCGVVASHAISQVDDTNRSKSLDSDEQREEGPIEHNPGFFDQYCITLRLIHDADDIKQSHVKLAELPPDMCILHISPCRYPGHIKYVYYAPINENGRKIAMKAALVREAGQAPVYGDFEDPAPEPGEVSIAVSAAAISHVVKSRASGRHYSSSGKPPFIVGIDGVGRLDDGRRVYFALPRAPYGSMAERTVVAESRCVPLPAELDDITAAAIANPGLSCWAAYTERAELRAGETVLVNGATGTAGRLAVQVAKHLGARKVIAVGRNPEALRTVAALGADETILLAENADVLEDAFKEQFANGVDVVIDYLWGRSAERLLIAAAKAGEEAVPIRFVQVGSVSGPDITLPSAVLRSSAIKLMGSGIGSIPMSRLIKATGELLRAAPSGNFKIATTPVPLPEVEQAWSRDNSSRRTVFTIQTSPR